MVDRYIYKVLIAQEDLLLGQGTVEQRRQNALVTVNAVDLPWVVQTLDQLRAIDHSKINHASVSTGSSFMTYTYIAGSTAEVDDVLFIMPDSGEGRWTALLTSDNILNTTAVSGSTIGGALQALQSAISSLSIPSTISQLYNDSAVSGANAALALNTLNAAVAELQDTVPDVQIRVANDGTTIFSDTATSLGLDSFDIVQGFNYFMQVDFILSGITEASGFILSSTGSVDDARNTIHITDTFGLDSSVFTAGAAFAGSVIPANLSGNQKKVSISCWFTALASTEMALFIHRHTATSSIAILNVAARLYKGQSVIS